MKSFLYYFTLLCSVGAMVLVTVKPQAVRNASVSLGEICGQIAETLKPEENTAFAETRNKEEQLADFLADSPYNKQEREEDLRPPVKNDNIRIANEPLAVNERVVPATYQEEITEKKQQPIRFASAVEEQQGGFAKTNTAAIPNSAQLSPFSSISVQQVAAQPIPAQPIAAETMPSYSSVYQQPIQQQPVQQPMQYVPASPQEGNYVPAVSNGYHNIPAQMPPAGQTSPAFQPSGQPFAIQPAVIAETVPCHGTETVARVGTQVILMCDILPQLRRVALKQYKEQLSKISEEEQKKVPEEEKEQFIEMFIAQFYPQFLAEQVNVMMIYNDFIMSKSKEEVEFYLKNIGQDFDENDVPAMMKEFGVNDLAALKTYLNKELGSSLERERLLYAQSQIAHQWLMNSVRTAEGECTHTEMMEYYTSHQSEFETKARVKYRELTVNFANHTAKLDAWKKIVWMGNETARGVPFDEMAKVNSEGFTASKGGLWDWISRGSITSKELEKTLFTQPVGMVNPPVIETATGLHIIQVVEREEDRLTPFIEAQVKIREKIRTQRRQKYQQEYLDELNRRFPSIVLREKIDFKTTLKPAPKTAQRTNSPAL